MSTTVSILLLSVWIAHVSGTNVNSTLPSILPNDCRDLLNEGNIYEGYYVVYPAATSHATMIYCSQDDGMEALRNEMTNQQPAQNCMDLLQDGMTSSGPNVIFPHLEQPDIPVLVFCDQETDGGGWTVIQNRYDGSEEFYRPWVEYAEGFGNVDLEHYLGNNNIAAITAQDINELRVDLEDWSKKKAFAHYQLFHVGNASEEYKMQVALYNGDAGDSLYWHAGYHFSTHDADNDYGDSQNCAEDRHGAWWYSGWGKTCTSSNLNGVYYPSAEITDDYASGMVWYNFQGNAYSLKASKMMIRGRPDADANIGN